MGGLQESTKADTGKKDDSEEVRELTEAMAIVKIDTEKFKESFDNRLVVMQKAQADDNS